MGFLLCFFSAHGQYTTSELVYGTTLFRKDFGGQLNTLDQYNAGRPIQYVGLGISGRFMLDNKWPFFGGFLAAKYLPQAFRVSDSVSGVITGSIFGMTAGFDCFPKVKRLDVIVSGGLNLGRLKLIRDHWNFLDYRGNELHRKNMLICPKASVMTKYYIRQFCLTLSAEYQYDISNSRWKEKILATGKPSSVPVAGFNQTGLNLSIGLGWIIPMGSSSGWRSEGYEPD